MLEALVLAAMIAVYEFERRFARRIVALASEYEAKVIADAMLARRTPLDPVEPANTNARAFAGPSSPAPADAETQPPASYIRVDSPATGVERRNARRAA